MTMIETKGVVVVLRCGPCRHEEHIPLEKFRNPRISCDNCLRTGHSGWMDLKGVIITDWISVKDKMPTGSWSRTLSKYSEEVLVANSCAVTIAHYNRKRGWWQTDNPRDETWIDKITHWMPLPKNPHD